jgi:hypothetical protein
MSEHEQTNLQRSGGTERLREALTKIRKTPVMPFPDAGAHSWRAFGEAVYRAWCDIQRIAEAALADSPQPGPDHLCTCGSQGHSDSNCLYRPESAAPAPSSARCPTCTSSVRGIKAGIAYGVLEPGECPDEWHTERTLAEMPPVEPTFDLEGISDVMDRIFAGQRELTPAEQKSLRGIYRKLYKKVDGAEMPPAEAPGPCSMCVEEFKTGLYCSFCGRKKAMPPAWQGAGDDLWQRCLSLVEACRIKQSDKWDFAYKLEQICNQYAAELRALAALEKKK